MPSDRFIVVSSLIMVCAHLALWANVMNNYGKTASGLLDNWDGGHYTIIVEKGYSGLAWAFYPLYPMMVRVLGFITGGIFSPSVLGTLFSIGLFAFFVWGVLHVRRRGYEAATLLPNSRLGWIVFLFAPCSYVFHSHHTESLFLVLVGAVLLLSANKKWFLAAVLAGLAALTKNQGVMLAVACGVGALLTQGEGRIRRFLIVGGVSGALFSLYPLFQHLETGSPFTFVSIQHEWRDEVSGSAYLRAFWFGNSWQNTNSGSVARLIFFWLLFFGAVYFAYLTRQVVVSTYLILHILLMPAGGDFVGAFRYGTVLFPLLFFIGDQVATRTKRFSGLLWGLVLWLVWFNCNMALRYAKMKWSY